MLPARRPPAAPRAVLAVVIALVLVGDVVALRSGGRGDGSDVDGDGRRGDVVTDAAASTVCGVAKSVGGSPTQRREVDDACAATKDGEVVARRRVGAVEITFHSDGGDLDEQVVADAVAAFDHHVKLLGPPTVPGVEVVRVVLDEPARGKAGPGFVLVDDVEVAPPQDCVEFRASAGVDGTCGSWVVAHEMAHEWFRWTTFRNALGDNPAVIEGTADYLAFDWWRSARGEEDAQRLVVELFQKRMDLARPFVTQHVPATPPQDMTDAQSRALVYGRASGVWIALERAIGIPATHDALRAVFEAGLAHDVTIDGVLEVVRQKVPEAAPLLRRWWTDTSFTPTLVAPPPPPRRGR